MAYIDKPMKSSPMFISDLKPMRSSPINMLDNGTWELGEEDYEPISALDEAPPMAINKPKREFHPLLKRPIPEWGIDYGNITSDEVIEYLKSIINKDDNAIDRIEKTVKERARKNQPKPHYHSNKIKKEKKLDTAIYQYLESNPEVLNKYIKQYIKNNISVDYKKVSSYYGEPKIKIILKDGKDIISESTVGLYVDRI